ncbi:MAG: DNA primase [Planctomycetota bacterium]|nr:DNA primase [Planctomycetota bacterium]MDA1211206.1 DNA primase [Planctomycetota bacterium]
MSSAASIEFKELLRSRTNLVDLVSESLALVPQSGGSVFKGLCPWHEDRSPSLCVYPDRQSWRCWVCNDGGDCFSWIMKREGLNFPEAMELLAQRAHLEVPRSNRFQANNGPSNASLYDVLKWAEQEFVNALKNGPEAKRARDYLASRGFTAETIEKFRIGFHPPHWDWIIRRAQGKFSLDQLKAVKLAKLGSEGRNHYSVFYDRVMFPIYDERSRVVAFGGRVLPDKAHNTPSKYLNSDESPVFFKSRTLYGLNVARHAISQSHVAAVMEGYTDCIMTHQFGIPVAVATLGTALTETHVTLLKRFSRKVVLIYDGDEPGQKAAERSVGRFLNQDIDLRILTLPDQLDPADYLSQHGTDALNALIETAPEAWDFKLRRLLAQYGSENVDARQRAAQEMVALLASVPSLANEIREDLILSRVADRLRIPESRLRIQLDEQRKKAPASRNQPVRVDKPSPAGGKIENPDDPHYRLECDLLEMIFASDQPSSLLSYMPSIETRDFEHAALGQLFQICRDCTHEGIEPTYDRITTIVEDPELKRWAAYLDEAARQKGIAERLTATSDNYSYESTDVETDIPDYLQHVLKGWDKLLERREHEQRLTDYSTTTGLASDEAQTQALLKQAMEFHQRRATRNT